MTPEDWKRIKYFKQSEFDSRDKPGSGANMNFSFLLMLDTLRLQWGLPLRVNSGYRTRAHNALVGGKTNSSHLRGLAADLQVDSLTQAIRLAILAAQLGFKRIGVDKKGRYIHIDIDETLPHPAVWFYNESAFA